MMDGIWLRTSLTERTTGSGSALEVVCDEALYKSVFTLFYFGSAQQLFDDCYYLIVVLLR